MPIFPAGPRATQETDREQRVRIVIPRGMAGIPEQERLQLQKLLDGELSPPPQGGSASGKKKWSQRDVRGMLDLVTMRLKAEARRKGKVDREELSKAYDSPRALDKQMMGNNKGEEEENELE